MKKNLIKLFMMTLTGLSLAGCYPSGPDYAEELDVVYTDYDNQFDFKSKSTYSIPSKIVVDIEENIDGSIDTVYMKDVYAQPILKSIKSNMTKKGWTETTIDNNPDMLVTPAGISSTTVFYSYWYDWWYGGYYGGWGWYYPPYYSVSSITTGSLVIVMASPKTDSAINSVPRAWLTSISGVLSGDYNLSRVEKGINQAFNQSPYLKTN